MPVWQQYPQRTQRSFLPSSSTTSINEAPFCQFCLASNLQATQCPEIAPQLSTTLINTHEANLSSMARQPQWCPSSSYCGQSKSTYGIILILQRCPNASIKNHQPKLWKPSPMTKDAKRLWHRCRLKWSCKIQEDATLRSFQPCTPMHLSQIWSRATGKALLLRKGVAWNSFATNTSENIRPDTSAKSNIRPPPPFLWLDGIINKAADASLRLKTTGTDQTLTSDRVPVTCITVSIFTEKGEARAMCMRDYDVLIHYEVIRVPAVHAMRHGLTPNRTNVGIAHRNS